MVRQETDCLVWPENMAIVEIFCDCETQWRWATLARGGADVKTGLDYSAVAVVMDAHGIEQGQKKETLQGVRVMEMSALRAWKIIS